ncbi:hypothetical protein V7S43_000141 [Phytophthora oleae]|uniref:Uncharacterized protein n=1 Tax=Phytophthora oleae TaxID=2107226 RepID=A0ABD3G673_9STRA
MGDTKTRALVVEVPKLFYQLFTAGISITGPTSAPLSDTSSVEDLQHAVEATYGETPVRGIAASDLKVYANLDAYGKEDPMEFTRTLVGCGVDANHLVVVEVPRKRQKTRWTTNSFDLSTSVLPRLGDCQQSIWKFNANLISGFQVNCFSDKLILFRREGVATYSDSCETEFYVMVTVDSFWGRRGQGNQQLVRLLHRHLRVLTGSLRGFISDTEALLETL